MDYIVSLFELALLPFSLYDFDFAWIFYGLITALFGLGTVVRLVKLVAGKEWGRGL